MLLIENYTITFSQFPLSSDMIDQSIFNETKNDSSQWFCQRQKRVTASMIGSVVRARTFAVERKILDKHLQIQPPGRVPFPCRYGKLQEPVARKMYIEHMERKGFPVTVYPCGLCVNKDYPYIGATPDGLVKTNCPEYPLVVLEIKTVWDSSPISDAKTLQVIAAERPNFYLRFDKKDGTLTLKHNHAYYYQIITQLAVMQLPLAHLVVFLPKRPELSVFEIEFNQAIWDKITARSKVYYEEHLKPIVDNDAIVTEDRYVSVNNLYEQMDIS